MKLCMFNRKSYGSTAFCNNLLICKQVYAWFWHRDVRSSSLLILYRIHTHTQGLAQRANNYVYQVLVPRQLGTAPIYQRYEITLLLHTKISYFQGQVNATRKSHTHNVPVTNLNYGQSFFMCSVSVRQQLYKINFLVVSTYLVEIVFARKNMYNVHSVFLRRRFSFHKNKYT